MIKASSLFVCQNCVYEQPRWFGKCPQCGEWNSAVETIQEYKSRRAGEREKNRATKNEPISLASISAKSTSRISTKISELDRVLGGGLVFGQVVLIAGEPGIGKSTLLLQVANELTRELKNRKTKEQKGREKGFSVSQFLGSSVLYVSGEESASQIVIRAQRLGVRNNNIQLLEETDIDSVISTLRGASFKGVIVDSIQTMATTDLSGMAGSVGQVRECAYRLVRYAKENNVPVFIVGHVTKEGTVAGPSVLMHIVDTVLWFEGDKSLTFRLLRAVKNRFGPTDEVGVFSMEERGLVSVIDPEKTFLGKKRGSFAGDVTSCILQGTRPILIEVQSLVVPTKLPYPKRISQGVDVKRLELLLAVLTRRCGLPFYEQDVFVNVAGGISLKNDPSIDLAITLSCASSYFDKPLPKGLLVIGEVGLLGDIREVIAQEKRIKEAKRLGFRDVVTGKEVGYLQQAIKKYLR